MVLLTSIRPFTDRGRSQDRRWVSECMLVRPKMGLFWLWWGPGLSVASAGPETGDLWGPLGWAWCRGAGRSFVVPPLWWAQPEKETAVSLQT